MISPWIISTAILSLVTSVSLFYAFKFARVILRVEDAIGECLDVLDSRYGSITKILETPLFYNSPEVRKVLRDVSMSRDSILYVANTMMSIESKENLIARPEEGEEELGD
jgi:hypothetical protein